MVEIYVTVAVLTGEAPTTDVKVIDCLRRDRHRDGSCLDCSRQIVLTSVLPSSVVVIVLSGSV